MKSWERIEPTILTKIGYHMVIVKAFEMPNGKVATRVSFSGEGR